MASSQEVPSPPGGRRAGKTLKPDVVEECSDDSSDEESEIAEEDQEATGPGASATQLTQASTAAFSPPEPAIENMHPEDVTLAELRKWADPTVYQIDIRHLRWDLKQEWGQIRPLQPTMVNMYFHQLKQNPPRVPVRVLLRNMGAGIVSPIRREFTLTHSQMINTQSLAANTYLVP